MCFLYFKFLLYYRSVCIKISEGEDIKKSDGEDIKISDGEDIKISDGEYIKISEWGRYKDIH